MKRLVGSGFREPITIAWSLLTPRLQERLTHVEFLCGTTAAYVGLHRTGPYAFADGRTFSYDVLVHCAYRHNQGHLPADQRATTVVLPSFEAYVKADVPLHTVVLHELGHVLHEAIGFEWAAVPVTKYAHQNAHEAFAESFESFITRDWAYELMQERDPATLALFNGLAT